MAYMATVLLRQTVVVERKENKAPKSAYQLSVLILIAKYLDLRPLLDTSICWKLDHGDYHGYDALPLSFPVQL